MNFYDNAVDVHEAADLINCLNDVKHYVDNECTASLDDLKTKYEGR